jgi:RNA polymerase sigma-70 factor (ECF subfamily)
MPEPEAALPDDQLLARERRRTVEVAVGKLSEKLRDVVVLRFSGGLSYQAISEELDVPVGTVKSRLAAGMDKLRELLGEEAWP